MIIRIKKIYKKCFWETFFNFIFTLLLFLSSQIDIKFISYIFGMALCIFYVLYFISIKDINRLYNFILINLFMYFVFTLTYRKMIGKNAINYLLFLDILCLIYLFIIIKNKRLSINKVLNDNYLKILFILMVISSIVGISKNVTINNLVMVIFEYIKLIPVYISISYGEEILKKEQVKWLIFINMLPLPILALKFTQDDFGGLFGYVGSTPFIFALIFIYSYYISAYFYHVISKIKFIIISSIYYLILVIGEIKIALVLTPIITVIIYILTLRTHKKFDIRKHVNFIILFISIPFIFIVSFKALLNRYPEWQQIINQGPIEFYNTYTQKPNNRIYQIGRMKSLSFANEYLFDTIDDYIFGLGIGSAMPNQTAMFEVADYTMGWSNEYISLYNTEVYSTYGFRLGYHNSGLGIWYMENGIFGVAIYVLLILILIKRIFKLIKNGNSIEIKMMGIAGMAFLIYYCTLIIYYNVIFRYRIALIFYAYMGLLRYLELNFTEIKKDSLQCKKN